MLSHLRILDLTDGGASIGARILADLGAEVILVEPPGGVASRRLGPFADDTPDPERSLEFFANHRGKRSIVIDISSESDRERLLDLAEDADVWIEDGSFLLPKTGFDAVDFAERASRLVHTTISPYGEIGPKSDWAATDLTVTAASQVLLLTGDSDRAPLSCSIPQAFMHAGADAAGMALIALEERARSGLGQHIDVSAQTSMMAAGQAYVLAHGWNDTPISRTGGGIMSGRYPLRFIYECADGYVNLTLLFGRPIGEATGRFFEWMDEEGYSNDVLRAEDWVAYGYKLVNETTTLEAHAEVLAAIDRFMRTKTKAELFAAAFERRLLIVPLSDARDLMESEQLAARDFWAPVKHPDLDREVTYPGRFAQFSATPLSLTTPPPALGEFDRAIAVRRTTPDSTDGAPPSRDTPRDLPLAGLKVLDFTWVYAGPAITLQLAQYGATVIKVESGSARDALRASSPFKDGEPGQERSCNFSNVNLGKLSLGLNMKAEGARDIALKLVDWADIVVENYSPKAMRGFGLDWDTLRARKPELIMLSSSLSGATGPHAMLAGYGTMGASVAGFGFVTGWPDRRPAAPFVAYTDYVSPRFGLAAILAALDHRRRTGVGQHIDLSQAESTIHFLGVAPLDYSVNGRIASATGNAAPHYAPSGVYPVLGDDMWIAIAAPDQKSFESLARVAGTDWTRDARFSDPASRMAHREALDEAISSWTSQLAVDALESSLQEAGVPAHRVSDSRDALEDPQLKARNHFVDLEYAGLGALPYENARARFSATPAQLRPCPTLGQHNQWILGDLLGLTDEEMTELVISGAVE